MTRSGLVQQTLDQGGMVGADGVDAEFQLAVEIGGRVAGPADDPEVVLPGPVDMLVTNLPEIEVGTPDSGRQGAFGRFRSRARRRL